MSPEMDSALLSCILCCQFVACAYYFVILDGSMGK